MSWTLANTEDRARESPATFWIPTAGRRKALKPGYLAKLIFEEPGVGGERMWVEVLEVLDGGRYKGVLRNEPVTLSVTRGTELEFGTENIADVGFPHPDDA